MKRLTMLFVAVLTATTFAQGRDFGGTWVLDAEKSSPSRVPERWRSAGRGRSSDGVSWDRSASGSAHGWPRSPRTRRGFVEERERIRFIAVRDIQWIEAQDYCVQIHLAAERILRRGTLKQFLRTLDPAHFVRVHRSAAVNIRHVRELTITVSGGLTAKLASGAEVAVARAFRSHGTGRAPAGIAVTGQESRREVVLCYTDRVGSCRVLTPASSVSSPSDSLLLKCSLATRRYPAELMSMLGRSRMRQRSPES